MNKRRAENREMGALLALYGLPIGLEDDLAKDAIEEVSGNALYETTRAVLYGADYPVNHPMNLTKGRNSCRLREDCCRFALPPATVQAT